MFFDEIFNYSNIHENGFGLNWSAKTLPIIINSLDRQLISYKQLAHSLKLDKTVDI